MRALFQNAINPFNSFQENVFFYLDPTFVNIQFILLNGLLAQSEHVKQWLVKWNNILAIINYFLFIFFQNATNPSFFFYVGLCQKKKRDMQHIHQGLIL